MEYGMLHLVSSIFNVLAVIYLYQLLILVEEMFLLLLGTIAPNYVSLS